MGQGRETSRQDSGDRPFNDPQDIKKMARSGVFVVPMLCELIANKRPVLGSRCRYSPRLEQGPPYDSPRAAPPPQPPQGRYLCTHEVRALRRPGGCRLFALRTSGYGAVEELQGTTVD